MNSPEEHTVAVTAFIAAIAEGLRMLGAGGAPEDALYDTVATACARPAFDMVVDELIRQKTIKRVGGRLIYCGPCAQ